MHAMPEPGVHTGKLIPGTRLTIRADDPSAAIDHSTDPSRASTMPAIDRPSDDHAI